MTRGPKPNCHACFLCSFPCCVGARPISRLNPPPTPPPPLRSTRSDLGSPASHGSELVVATVVCVPSTTALAHLQSRWVGSKTVVARGAGV